jgi:uncharacterized RDD family membrane protein YckC
MRCPKCGYNSFDHLDSCKKCGKDLSEFKQNFGIKSVLFPGQTVAADSIANVEFDDAAADVAVQVATGATAAPDLTGSDVGVTPVETDGDDFGFDFMGDSADDDLSFDELFEEAPEDEDIEETLEGPKGDSAEVSPLDSVDDDADLEDSFGFDPEDEEVASAEDNFTFDDAGPEDSGTKEGPKRPFDLPESSPFAGAPEACPNLLNPQHSSGAAEEIIDLSVVEEVPEPQISEPGEIFAPAAPSFPEESSSPVEAAVPIFAMSAPGSVEVEPPVPSPAPVSQDQLSVDDSAVSAMSPPSLLSCVEAFVCDLALLAVIGISFVVAAETVLATGETRFIPSLEILINLSIPYFLVLFCLAFGYFTLFHFLVGQTPGKMLTGLRVETQEGDPLAFAQAFLRSVGGLLQLLPVGLGYLAVLFNSERRGWNDRLAGTRVIDLRNLPGGI